MQREVKQKAFSTGIPHFEIPFTNDSIHLFVIHAEVQLVNSATVYPIISQWDPFFSFPPRVPSRCTVENARIGAFIVTGAPVYTATFR